MPPGFIATMRTPIRNKSYRKIKPKNMTDEQWLESINDTLIKTTGLDEASAMQEEEYEQDAGRDDNCCMLSCLLICINSFWINCLPLIY